MDQYTELNHHLPVDLAKDAAIAAGKAAAAAGAKGSPYPGAFGALCSWYHHLLDDHIGALHRIKSLELHVANLQARINADACSRNPLVPTDDESTVQVNPTS